MSIYQKEFMIDCGNKMKKSIIEDFTYCNKIVSMNKEIQSKNPSLCLTHYIRMYIVKMKILNGYLKTDADYMEKQHEIFKKHAMIVIDEHEDLVDDVTVISCNPITMDTAETKVFNEEGGYLHICNLIKTENDMIEDYIGSVKKMNILKFHF
jgi:hypothetical protein